MVSSLVPPKAIGGAADANRMKRVVGFYEKLPRGPAPQPQAKGFLQWYQLKYMSGRNPSAARTYTHALRHLEREKGVESGSLRDPGGFPLGDPLFHLIGGLLVMNYANQYYFHLRTYRLT
ncbi:hypothetical protein D0859_16235 [Hortaea werneckii]|uniref:Uncharacterized protein n=1 Tax=Hortaea werneckii TaxID=91943 RepID=A0A3M7I2R9_HORWE|nr:hypothetical protein D0859_16235 [Hortaea werneckii]